MKKLNKRATEMYSADTFIFYLVFGIVVSILMIVFMLIIFNHLEDTAKIPGGLEEFSAIERFLSDECFALDNTDPQRAINWDKLTKENLDACYNVDNESKKIAFTLKLQVADNTKEIKTNNWNWEIGPKRIKSPIEVNVYHNNKIIDGKLIISEQNV